MHRGVSASYDLPVLFWDLSLLSLSDVRVPEEQMSQCFNRDCTLIAVHAFPHSWPISGSASSRIISYTVILTITLKSVDTKILGASWMICFFCLCHFWSHFRLYRLTAIFHLPPPFSIKLSSPSLPEHEDALQNPLQVLCPLTLIGSNTSASMYAVNKSESFNFPLCLDPDPNQLNFSTA